MDSIVPYREPHRATRFLCLGCYRTASAVPGECPECGVPLLDVADAPVRLQIREEAERRLLDRKWREEVPLFSATLLATVVAAGLLGVLSLPIQRALAVALFFPIQRLLTRAFARVRRGSAIATFAARRNRLAAELGTDVHVTLLEPSDQSVALTAADDPSSMDMPRLLEWMGVRADEPTR
jgi:hypothetical protein